jgi:hypothetical protein
MLENAKNYGMEIKDEDKFCEDYFMNLSEAFFTLKENL